MEVTRWCRPIEQRRFIAKCDIEKLRDELPKLNMSAQQLLLSTDVTFNNFMMGLGKLVKKNTPLKRFGFSPFSRWLSSDLKMGVINKKRLHRIYKSSGFARARTACKVLATGCYNRLEPYEELEMY